MQRLSSEEWLSLFEILMNNASKVSWWKTGEFSYECIYKNLNIKVSSDGHKNPFVCDFKITHKDFKEYIYYTANVKNENPEFYKKAYEFFMFLENNHSSFNNIIRELDLV